jgi:hypothetical protein
MERAYQLRDNREKEKSAIIKQKLDAQWRDACDDARTLDSKAMTKFMNEERLRQIKEKIERKKELSKNENSFLEEWNRQLEAIEAKDKAKRDYHHRMDMETSALLKQQVRYINISLNSNALHSPARTLNIFFSANSNLFLVALVSNND